MIKRLLTRRSALGIGIAWIAGSSILAKGTKKMANDTVTPPDGQDFFFGHWTIGKVRNSGVPLIVGSSISSYADLALAQGFHVGRLQNGRLVYMENWERIRRNVPLDTLIGDTPLSEFTIPLPSSDLSSQTPLFFQQLAGADDVWTQVPVDQTVGESTFIRLRLIRVEDKLMHIAEHVTQVLDRKAEYFYDASGAHVQSVFYDRSNDFEPVTHKVP